MNQSTIILKNEQESHMLRTVRHRSPRADEGKENGPAIHNTQVSFSSYRSKLNNSHDVTENTRDEQRR